MDWIKELAKELCRVRYRTLSEPEVVDIIRRYARSEHVQQVEEEIKKSDNEATQEDYDFVANKVG